MDELAAFSPDYATARRRFREATSRLGWELEAHPVGPDLTIDVAVTPAKGGGRALVTSSGLHGVEGFVGSAVQVGVLERWAENAGPPPDVRGVFLHALNPYGFANLRRFDQENVDPNRNFLREGEPYRGSPDGYAELNRLLNPERPPSRWEPFAPKALLAVARYGMPALKQIVVGGQYDFPRGIYYGGSGPSPTTRVLSEHLGRWLNGCDEIVHIDFHSGLGPRAACKLLIDYTLTDRQRARLNEWFGPDSYEICDPKRMSYNVRGGFDRWCVERNPGRDYLHLCAEYGTYGPIQVIGGLRAENQAHHWGRPTDPVTLRAKERLKELFCPASPEWRRKVLARGFELVDQALRCLTAPSSTPAGT